MGAVHAAGATPLTAQADTAVLRARISMLAHDSMLGRKTGTAGHQRATAWIVKELQRTGVRAGWRNGSYVQPVPALLIEIERRGMLRAGLRGFDGADVYRLGVDFLPLPGRDDIPFPRNINQLGRSLVYGGRLGSDSISSFDTDGKIILFDAPLRSDGMPDYQVWAYAEKLAQFSEARGILIAALDFAPRSLRERMLAPWIELPGWKPDPGIKPVMLVTRAVAGLLRDKKDAGASMHFGWRSTPITPPPANVIAMIEGSDAALRGEYVLVSAHSDHLGVAAADQRSNDSIYNGANAATGIAALLHAADALARGTQRPKRSVLFVVHAGMEQGGLGVRHFRENPAVPAGAIVAEVAVDHLGSTPLVCAAVPRGGPADVPAVAIGSGTVFRLRGARRRSDRDVNDDVARLDLGAVAAAADRLVATVLKLAEAGVPASADALQNDPCDTPPRP
jgi:hypothetical protein